MAHAYLWAEDVDEDAVERLIAAIQRAVADELPAAPVDGGWSVLPAPALATALMALLAELVEQAPECATPRGMRMTSEALGRDLLDMMRETRRLREAEAARAN